MRFAQKEEMALKQSTPLAPHLSLLRALSQARMNLKCCSLVDEHCGAIVKRLKNQLLSKKAKDGIGKSRLYGQFSEKAYVWLYVYWLCIEGAIHLAK